MDDRLVDVERISRAYAELGLAVAFTDGIEGAAAKRITGSWERTRPSSNGDFVASLMAQRCQTRNPAIVVGASGLIGVDIDGPAGRELFAEMFGRMPWTVTVLTGKGHHLYFRPPEDAPALAVFEFSETGVRSWREKYFIAPPALHPSGRVYRFLAGRAPWETEPAVMAPETLAAMLAAVATSRRTDNGDGPPGEPILEGERNEHLFSRWRRHAPARDDRAGDPRGADGHQRGPLPAAASRRRGCQDRPLGLCL
jgi:hypothetical protein